MPSFSNIGLFGYINNGTEITNLGLINVSVTGYQFAGGLVGRNRGNISNCYSTGNVTGTTKTGGLVGNNSGNITNCYSSGNVTGEYQTGGLLGLNEVTIENCYSTGSVTGNHHTGGLVGYNFAIITNCYSTGSVTGVDYTGGLIGDNDNLGATSNSFWDRQTSGQSSSAGGIGKTTAQMKTQSTYTNAGWSFPDIWNMNPDLNNGYPYLNYPNSVSIDDVTIEIPLMTKAVLHSAYPNPFNPSTTISFDLAKTETVKIDIYNIKGQIVKSLVNKAYDKGKYSLVWDGKDNKSTNCGTGVYFYKMTAGKTTQTKKMMMIK